MARKRIFVVLMGLVLCDASAAAATECSTLSRPQAMACLERQKAMQEKTLSGLVDRWVAKVDPADIGADNAEGARRAIRSAQAAWRSWRDAECSIVGFYMRRGIQEAIDDCVAEKNAARILDIRREAGF